MGKRGGLHQIKEIKRTEAQKNPRKIPPDLAYKIGFTTNYLDMMCCCEMNFGTKISCRCHFRDNQETILILSSLTFQSLSYGQYKILNTRSL